MAKSNEEMLADRDALEKLMAWPKEMTEADQVAYLNKMGEMIDARVRVRAGIQSQARIERDEMVAALEVPGALDEADATLAKRTPILEPWWKRFGLFVARLWRRKRGPVVTEAFGTMDAQHREQMVQFARATGDESLLRGLKLVSVGKR